jgi:hypothetical protein
LWIGRSGLRAHPGGRQLQNSTRRPSAESWTDFIEEQIDPGAPEAYRKQKLVERYVKIPPHYKDFRRSGLAIDLQPGLNQPQEFELKDN